MGEWRCLGAGIGCGGRDDPDSCDDANGRQWYPLPNGVKSINPTSGATHDYYGPVTVTEMGASRPSSKTGSSIGFATSHDQNRMSGDKNGAR